MVAYKIKSHKVLDPVTAAAPASFVSVQEEKMPRRSRARRQTLQPGIQKRKIRSKKADGKGAFHLLEQSIPPSHLHNFFYMCSDLFRLVYQIQLPTFTRPLFCFKGWEIGKIFNQEALDSSVTSFHTGPKHVAQACLIRLAE